MTPDEEQKKTEALLAAMLEGTNNYLKNRMEESKSTFAPFWNTVNKILGDPNKEQDKQAKELKDDIIELQKELQKLSDTKNMSTENKEGIKDNGEIVKILRGKAFNLILQFKVINEPPVGVQVLERPPLLAYSYPDLVHSIMRACVGAKNDQDLDDNKGFYAKGKVDNLFEEESFGKEWKKHNEDFADQSSAFVAALMTTMEKEKIATLKQLHQAPGPGGQKR